MFSLNLCSALWLHFIPHNSSFTLVARRQAIHSSTWLGNRSALLPNVDWRDQTPLCEHDAKAQARLAAELLRFDEVLYQNASIRFDNAL